MTAHLRAADISRLRAQPGHAAGLFITDRCPVGCAHCSVNSRADSPKIEDFELLKALVEGLACDAVLEVVAITGGEPLVERHGIELATSVLKRAGKKIVLFTSGVWAKSKVTSWVLPVLCKIDTVFLSTDQYHEETVDQHIFVAAARAIAEAGCWIVVQTIDRERDLQQVKDRLFAAFGDNYSHYVESGGPGCLNSFSASISGASAGVRLPCGGTAA
jgi:organic radical activating enzyme